MPKGRKKYIEEECCATRIPLCFIYRAISVTAAYSVCVSSRVCAYPMYSKIAVRVVI